MTNGHLDIIHRYRKHLFDQVIVAVSQNSSKSPYFFPGRSGLTHFSRSAVAGQSGITVESFSGLLATYMKKKKAVAVIRGLRAISDFEYEFQMALMNRRQNIRFETVFLMPDERYTYLSSSLVREISRLGGTVRGLVPVPVEIALKKRALTTH